MERANTIRHLPHLATPKNTLQHRRCPTGCEWSALEPWRPNILGFERPFPPRRATGCPQAKPNCEAVMNLQVDDVVFDSSGEKCLLSEGVLHRVGRHPTPSVAPSHTRCGAVPAVVGRHPTRASRPHAIPRTVPLQIDVLARLRRQKRRFRAAQIGGRALPPTSQPSPPSAGRAALEMAPRGQNGPTGRTIVDRGEADGQKGQRAGALLA